MTRRTRFLASLVALVTLAFAQFTVSAHACSLMAAAQVTSSQAGHPDCCPDASPSNVCAGHCSYGAASLDWAKPLPAIADAVGPYLGMVPATPVTRMQASISHPVRALAGPPPALRTFALRI